MPAQDRLELALGGAHDIWGFWDWQPRRQLTAPDATLVLGPRRTRGKSFVLRPGTGIHTAQSD